VRRPKPDSVTSSATAGEIARGAGKGSERTVRTAALGLLAGRDFSRNELTERLLRKGHAAEIIQEVVGALVQEGLLHEARYVEQFVTQHAGRGQGPQRIRMELRERGVDAEAIESGLDNAETDWVKAAREARRRKFGVSLPRAYRERAKQARFLQYRGFSSDQIRAALETGGDELNP
jgi:regulatory protein